VPVGSSMCSSSAGIGNGLMTNTRRSRQTFGHTSSSMQVLNSKLSITSRQCSLTAQSQSFLAPPSPCCTPSRF
jgi:hypothetical protein